MYFMVVSLRVGGRGLAAPSTWTNGGRRNRQASASSSRRPRRPPPDQAEGDEDDTGQVADLETAPAERRGLDDQDDPDHDERDREDAVHEQHRLTRSAA